MSTNSTVQAALTNEWLDQPYDDALYMASLEKRNPTLHAAALKIILPKEEKAA